MSEKEQQRVTSLRLPNTLATALTLTIIASCTRTESKNPENSGDQKAAVSPAPAPASGKLVYPWSVVSGGIDSPLAIGQAMRNDPIVASHYTGLIPSRFHTERLETPRRGYVSYRIRDKIYWSRRMVTLAVGETILTDGESVLRGRCGNRVSTIAQQPVAPESVEPAEETMDRPVRADQLVAVPVANPQPNIETAKFHNPKEASPADSSQSLLPSPQPEEPLPPAWVTAPTSRQPAIVAGATGPQSGSPQPGQPPANPSTPAIPPSPGTISVPPSAPALPLEVAPPMVLVSLIQPPFPPVQPPQGPPSWDHPTFPPTPPSVHERPPQTYPPPATPPPHTTPPPQGPPPNTPVPPTGPPPSDPPIPHPPGPLPPNPVPEVPVPEPGILVFVSIGLVAIALGSFRRKS